MNTINKTTKLAGSLYLMMTPFAIFSIMYVPSILFVPGDTATTVNNIMTSGGLFRLGIASWLICQTIFIFLLVELYKLLKIVNKSQALLMLVLALTAVPIAFINELNHIAVLLLVNGAEHYTVVELSQLHEQVALFLNLHTHGIHIAQVFWGLWLFPFGYLVYTSGFLPKLLGILLMIGGVGYLFDVVAFLLVPNFNVIISPVTGIGELLFPLWLLFKGVNSEQWELKNRSVLDI